MSGLPILLAALLIIDNCANDFVDGSSCQVTYMALDGNIYCRKTEDSLRELNRTHIVLKYECDGVEDVYENCPRVSGKFDFVIRGCALTPDTFNFCNGYEIVQIHTHIGNYKNVVLRNGTFGKHRGVSYIFLPGSCIHTVESGAFGCSKELLFLNLSKNDIEELPDDTFRCLSKLMALDLSYNRLKMLPKCLGDLSSLRVLYLGDNWITVFPETALHKTARLSHLGLDRNSIQKFCPSEISQLDDLWFLYLRGNNISSLTKECFTKQKYLLMLDIGMNVGLVLANDVFAGRCALSLYIDGCGFNIGVEGSMMFSNCTYLMRLHLQHNRLEEIHSDLFLNLTRLEHLDLSFNAISMLHNRSFAKKYRLEYLDLSNNFLDEIKRGQFSGMYNVKILNISNNNIKNVAENAFEDLIFLKTLSVANNNISQMTGQSSFPMRTFKKIFHNLESLENLDMSNFTSRDLILSFSKKNKNIEYLDVSFNVGLRLDENSLKNLKNLRNFISRGTNVDCLDNLFIHNTVLEEINLSLNKFERINLTELTTVENLRKLDLSWNNINIVLSSFFKIKKLEYLNLSHNALSNAFISYDIYEKIHLKDLDISSNRIASINCISLDFVDNLWASNNPINELFLSDLVTTSLKTVHLEDCKIRYVHLHSKLEMKIWVNSGRTVFYMAKNPVVCDCHAFQLYEYIQHPGVNRRFLFEGLTCRRPEELEGKKMENLLPGDFSCEVRRSCPETCHCLKRAHDHTVTVNCSRRDLGRLPEDVPTNTTVLDVSYNRITSLQLLNSSIWRNLTEIPAEANFSSSLELQVPKSMKIFLLHGNRLTKLPERYTVITLSDLHITLSKNPWPCGCESLHLKNFLSRNVAQIPDASEVRCFPSTNSTSNWTLLEMREQDLCPTTEKGSLKEAIFISLISFLSVLVLVLSVWLYYTKNENFVKAVIYTHCACMVNLLGCRKVVEEDKFFDCFISYDSKDVDVPLAIVDALGKDSDPEFRFCVHDRHWRGGSTISENIFRSVELSRKTLIIISRTFIKNRWFYLEFQAALMQMLKDRRDRMIFAVKGDLPDYEELPRDIRHFLRTRTYLVWGEKWFMEKLRYSLQEESVPFRVQLREFLLIVGNCFRTKRLYHPETLPEEIV